MSNDLFAVTTVLAPAATHHLTDLASAKDELSLTDDNTTDDAWLDRALGQVSTAITKHTKRVFVPEFVQDAIDLRRSRSQSPSGPWELQLARWPVLTVVSAVQTLSGGSTQALVLGTDFEVDADKGQLLRLDSSNTGRVTAWEALPLTVQYAAGYGAFVSEAQTVPATPYQVTVTKAGKFSCDVAVTYANGTALARVTASPAHGQYTVAKGVYTFNAADAAASLTIGYCVAAIPPDLTEIVLRLITARYKARGRDPALVEQDTPGVGIRRWWFGSAPGQTGRFTPDIEAALEDYRTPTIA